MPSTPSPTATLASGDGDTPAWEKSPPPTTGISTPKAERYQHLREIARGGLGRILAAEDQELGRPVALKELIRDSPGNRARFLREIRFTARLQHPSIIPFYDAVIGNDGVLRYAMKLVTGTTLADAIAATNGIEERIALLPHILAVADAVAYAHDRGVIHRDIKPQNVLIGRFGETLLIDWGVAKDLGDAEDAKGVEAESEDAGLTRMGAVVGTPAYMAPEQARGEPADRRSDVYALGATLYHLLAGHPPFGLDAGSTMDALRAGRPPAPVETQVPEVPPDLASIVHRAMAFAPEARYVSGQALRQDLQRFMTGQLVAAQRYTPADLLRRWLHRHRAILSVVGVAALLVIGSAIIATVRVVEERNIARNAQALAETRSNALTLAHAARSLENDPTEAATWLAAYPSEGVDFERLFMLTQDVVSRGVARVVARSPDVSCNVPVFDANGHAIFVIGTATMRVDAWTGEISIGMAQNQAEIGVALGQDEALIASPIGSIFRLDAHGKQTQIATIPDAPTTLVTDGAVAIVGDKKGGITRVDLATGAIHVLATAQMRINGLALHGTSWSAVAGDGAVWTGPMDGGPAHIRFQNASSILSLQALQEGTLLLGDDTGAVIRLDPADRAQILMKLPGGIRLLALGNDEQLLIAGDGSGTSRALVLGISEVEIAPPWGNVLVLGLAVAPHDGVMAAVLEDGTLHLWRPATGEEQVRRESSKMAGPMAFSADGVSLATCAMDSALRVWPVPALVGRVYRGHTGRIFHPIFLPDGRVATDSDDQTVRVWPRAGGEARVLRGHNDDVYGLEASIDGRYIVSASSDGLAIVWDVDTGEALPLRGHQGRVRRAFFTPDGQRILTGGRDGTLRSWALDGTPLQVTDAHVGGVHWLALADDGHHVWSVGRDRSLRLWDPDTGQIRTLATHLGSEGDLALRVFPLSGGRALTCANKMTLVIVSSDGSQKIFASPNKVVCPSIEVSPDGRFAAVPVGAALSVLNLESGEWQGLGGLPDDIHSVDWSPDGRLLALAGLDGTARLLRLSDGAGAVIVRSEAGILGVRFSPDGRQLAVGGLDRLLWVGPVDEAQLLPHDPSALRAQIMKLTQAKFEASAVPAR